MTVKKLNDGSYQKLIEYAVKKCNKFSLLQYLFQKPVQYNIIISELKNNNPTLLEKNCADNVNKIYKIYSDDIRLFDDKYYLEHENINVENAKKGFIEQILKYYKNDIKSKKILSNNKKSIILKEDIFSDVLGCLYQTIYTFKIDNGTTKLLKNMRLFSEENMYNDSIIGGCLEDLCLYKNEHCWLDSVSHEDICDIYCDSEQEYEYLKSIGIEFYEDHYIPLKKDS